MKYDVKRERETQGDKRKKKLISFSSQQLEQYKAE